MVWPMAKIPHLTITTPILNLIDMLYTEFLWNNPLAQDKWIGKVVYALKNMTSCMEEIPYQKFNYANLWNFIKYLAFYLYLGTFDLWSEMELMPWFIPSWAGKISTKSLKNFKVVSMVGLKYSKRTTFLNICIGKIVNIVPRF